MSGNKLSAHVSLIPDVLYAILEVAATDVLDRREKKRRARSRGVGVTLRPGNGTPLWNDLRTAVRASTTAYGDQAQLARILGLPRQRVNSYLTGGGQMPDAERTLMMLGWLAAKRAGRPQS